MQWFKNRNRLAGAKMKKINLLCITGLLSITPTFIAASPNYEAVVNQFYKHKQDPLMQDLFVNNMFVPPYKDYSSIRALAKTCYEEIWEEDRYVREIIKVSTKEEYLSIASGSDNSILYSFIDNSGGSVILSDYVSADFAYLMNLGSLASQQSEILFDDFVNSPQYEKAKSEVLKIYKEKGVSSKATLSCSILDMYYTLLGGEEHSISKDIMSSLKNQIHRRAMKNAMSELN